MKSRITARKYGGNDSHSWAVFIDGEPMVTGLTYREVAYYKKEAAAVLERRRNGRATVEPPATGQHGVNI